MKKPIIAVDIDDVLADSSEALRREVNKMLGIDLQPKDYLVPGEYTGYYEQVWLKHGLQGKITLAEMYPRMKASQAHVLPHKHALNVLHELRRHYELIIVSGRQHDWQVATEDWILQHFPGIFTKVLLAGGEEGLQQKSKGQLCVENDVVWLIDDNVDHALSAEELGVKVLVFGTYGWHHKMPPHMTKCKDWNAVLEYFNGQK